MTHLITDTVAARLGAAGAVARPQDLYAGTGAAFYERLVGPDRVEIREVLALARDADGPVLDIAAGSGRLTIPLVRSGRRVTAIDLSEDMLALLRRALPEDAAIDCVVADMRDFTLAGRYALAVLGATSITLLDREGRSRLYDRVRRHLAPGGIFAVTVAGGASAHSLTVATDREVVVPGPDGDEDWVFSQQMEGDGAVRLVNWVRAADVVEGAAVTVLTSRLRVLEAETLSRELVDAGFLVPDVAPVRSPAGDDIRLLRTRCADPAEGTGDDAAV